MALEREIESRYREQVQLLVRVLPFVAQEKCFALKGGTAINLFIRDMPRLSVDIDLAYLPDETRELALRHVREALTRIAENIQKNLPNVTAKLAFNRDDELRVLVSNAQAQIKIEVSPVLRGTLHAPEERDVAAIVEEEFGFAAMPVVSMPDLYGGKLCAALDRQHPRDWFDVMLLLRAEGLTRSVFEGFLVYLISHGRPMAELLSPRWKDLQDIYAAEFSGMTREPIEVSLLENTRAELLTAMREQITPKDVEFLLSIKRGQPNWSLLNLPGVESLPAVRWKIMNIQKMPDTKRAEALVRLEGVLNKWVENKN